MAKRAGAAGNREEIARLLRVRDALHEWDEVACDVVAQGDDRRLPLVSVVLPTYRRPHLLAEAVNSILALRFDRPWELVVVDNDPESDGADALVSRFPELRTRNFRYLRNRCNIGMFGNFNRCIESARGEWATILNDDDMLDADFLPVMFATIDRDARIDGIACQKRILYQSTTIQPPSLWSPRRVAKRLLVESLFGGRAARRIPPRKLFWGLLLGNSAGFLFRTAAARAVGGFYAEELESADYWFTTRFAAMFDLRQHRATLATVRVAENETGQVDAVKGQMQAAHTLRRLMAGSIVPASWTGLVPLLTARDRAAYREHWHVDLSHGEVEALVKAPVGTDRPYALWMIRFLLRGY